MVPALLSTAAEWMLLGGIERLVDYWAADVDPAARLAQLQLAKTQVLIRNERGLTRHI